MGAQDPPGDSCESGENEEPIPKGRTCASIFCRVSDLEFVGQLVLPVVAGGVICILCKAMHHTQSKIGVLSVEEVLLMLGITGEEYGVEASVGAAVRQAIDEASVIELEIVLNHPVVRTVFVHFESEHDHFTRFDLNHLDIAQLLYLLDTGGATSVKEVPLSKCNVGDFR